MPNNERPAFRPELETVDFIWEGLSVLALLLLFSLPAAYYFDLPDTIPQHYNAHGDPDTYGHKAIIWVLPVLGIFMFGLLTPLSRMPHIYNYPIKITAENAPFQYKLAGRLIRVMKAFVLVIFVFLTWKMIDGAISGNLPLGIYFLWIFLGSLAGLIGWYFWAALRR